MKKIRAVAALLAFAVLAALGTVLATPAQADTSCPYGPNNPPCVDYVLWMPLFDDGCPYCPEFAIGFDDFAIQPQATRWRYINQVREGLRLLDLAAQTGDPAVVKNLRAGALKRFTSAAGTLGGVLVKPGAVGTYDRKSGKLEPQPMGWLEAAAQYLADGLDGLVAGKQLDPDAQLEPFDAAYGELSKGAQLG